MDAGCVSRVRASNRAGTGSASMTVNGASMGIVTYTQSARYGKTGCESTDWASETSVRCQLGGGAGGTRRSVMTVGQRIGSVSKAWSADTMRMSRTRRGNRASKGSASMTVHGSRIGIVRYTVRGRPGHTGCEGTDWQSGTSVRCRVGHGAAGTQRVVITVLGWGASATRGWSMDAGSVSRMRASNRAGTASASMMVHGASMGIVTFTGRAQYSTIGCESTDWASETSVSCQLGHGAGGTRRSVMTAGQRIGSATKAWSADTSRMSRTRRGNRAGTGSASMTMHGSSMGITIYTVRGCLGHTACEGTDWQSETSVRCHVGYGGAGTRRVIMTARGRGASATLGWSVDAGMLSRTRASNRAGTGSASMTVNGASMGIVTYTGRSRYGKTGCETTDWASETSVRCLLEHGAGGTRRSVMTVGQRIGSASKAWSADTMRRLEH